MNRTDKHPPAAPEPRFRHQRLESDLTNRAWDSTNPEEQVEVVGAGKADLTREQKRVTPDEVRKHAIAQGTDRPAIPGGRNPDSAMCEDRDHPGLIDKSNDC